MTERASGTETANSEPHEALKFGVVIPSYGPQVHPS
jgi:hypothetical protein